MNSFCFRYHCLDLVFGAGIERSTIVPVRNVIMWPGLLFFCDYVETKRVFTVICQICWFLRSLWKLISSTHLRRIPKSIHTRIYDTIDLSIFYYTVFNNHKQFSSVLWILILCDINYCSINENIRYELIESTLLRFISYRKIIKWIYRVKTYIHYTPLWNKIKKTNKIQLIIYSSALFLNSFLWYLSWLRGIFFCFSISKLYSVTIYFHII